MRCSISRYIKKMWVLCLAILLSLVATAQAAEITAIDFSGNIIGQVISTGMVINEDGNNIGTITADSLIINEDGAVIGGVVPQGIAIGMDNRLLGKVHTDGFVRSLSGRTLGKALPNGLVIDDSAEVIGAILYPGLIYSPKGDALGRLTGGGEYTKLEGQRIGFVSANGYAYRRSGDEYILDGRLMSSKMVVSVDGRFLGSIAPSGKIVDFEGKEIGKIHANGYAYNSANRIIGSVIATGYAFDQIGKYIGIVSYNGEVKQGERVVARYRADGSLVRANGDVVGFAVNISATANDNLGRYLGYIVPGGNIVRGGQIMGHIGAKGYVYDEQNNKIGALVQTGPVYDALAHLKGQSLPNGRIISTSGGEIGYARGRYAFDDNRTLIGGVASGMIAVDNTQQTLGMNNIDASVASDVGGGKISPFGYLFNADGKVFGGGYQLSAAYGLEGTLYSYINPNGELYRQGTGAKLTPSGILLESKGYVGALITPMYALDFEGNSLGRFANSNLILNKSNAIAYKIVPAGYAVETNDAASAAMSPLKGFADNKMIALNIGGDLIGYADSTGTVIGLNGNIYGKVVYNEYIIDNNRAINGKLITFAPVVNEKCSVIGVVNGKGDIVNSRDVIIGRLLPNGQAISDAGNYIGYAVQGNGLIDFNGNFVGTVNAGFGTDFEGKSLGCVNREGLVLNQTKAQQYGVIIPAPVIDFENKIIGNVAANGQVFGADSQLVGYMQPNGNVVSKSKKVLGNVMRYQVAYTDANKFLGMVSAGGMVINEAGKPVGEVNFDGSVQANGENIGYALYDFYVYDENFSTYGYLTKDGTVLSPVGSRLGQLDRGFVTDRSGQVIARGNRDYIVRDVSQNPVGVLHLDGTVTDFEGQNIGYLTETGIIRNADGNEIALATPYQYYIYVPKTTAEAEPEYKPRRRPTIADAETEQSQPQTQTTQPSTVSETKVKRQKLGNRIVGIALNPEGDIIGNIYDDGTVRDDNGDLKGYVDQDGNVVDVNHNLIGFEEIRRPSASEMFIPPNAYGTGNPYGHGERPTNVGAGGGYGQGERYDPLRAQALMAAQNNRRNSLGMGELPADPSNNDAEVAAFTGYEKDGWDGGPSPNQISSWRVDMSEMILQDKGIPAVLARSVYASDSLSQKIPVTAIVERNVYAEEGRNVIIPAGSRVIGEVDSGGGVNANNGGAAKIGITWTRLIRPDGSQWRFSDAQTADAQGRAGAIGYLDQQLLKKYSLPLVTTTLQTAANWLLASGGNSTTSVSSDGTSTTTADARSQAMSDGRKNFNEQMKEILKEMIEDKEKIRSVTYVPAGTRIIIYPNEDLWLNSRERSKRISSSGSGGRDFDGKGGLLDPDEESRNPSDSGGVTYNGNYQNVQPASAPQGNPAAVPTRTPAPTSNVNQNPAGYVAPSSDQPLPSMDSGESSDVPELL
ncbi:MAG: TrbI/VirB10 family protein [Alphaproteobacteria bacterium]|nr:TrbI/VirB10 family protein [Alphaproteobacteria bacterium]